MGDIVELWPEQTAALDGLRMSLRGGRKHPVLELPTGSGKTVVAAKIVAGARAKGKRVAMTVPLMNLIDQTWERFCSYGVDPEEVGVTQADHPLSRPRAPVQICSVQTLTSRKQWPEADVVVVDECHVQHKVIYQWMAGRPGAVFVGLSATPWARGMADWWDDLVKPTTMKDLIEAKRLSRLCAFGPEKRLDLDDVKIVAGEYHEGQLSQKMRKKEIIADVVQTWCDVADNRPTLVFAVDRNHAAVLTDRFNSVGVATAYVDGEVGRDDRHVIVNAFNRGEFRVIVSIGTMNAGIDLDVRCVSYARPCKSEILFVQSVGRGMRWRADKDHLLLLDHTNCSTDMGLPMDIRFERLLPGRARNNVEIALGERTVKKPLICPQCRRLAEHGAKVCEGCGHAFKASTDVRELPGHLRAMSLEAAARADKRKVNRVWSVDEKARFFGELKTVRLAKGYKDGWAACKYKDRFGVWPNDPRVRYEPPRPVTLDTSSWLRSQQIRWANRKVAAE